ncbi:retrograde regulation protein 2 [Xylariomycetidae sp. FL2044]|nr:retrograde regulation protein 2 [Xylariomycetidae sp. FL2044]
MTSAEPRNTSGKALPEETVLIPTPSLDARYHDAAALRGDGLDDGADPDAEADVGPIDQALERRLRLKVDLRLCTIAGILFSLNLLDSGVISSASVTSMPSDLDLTGNRFSISIFIFTISSIVFQLPATLAVRFFRPRFFFSLITICFGLITMCTAFIQTWQQMIVLRILLGMAMSGIYPGLTYLVSTWYRRQEQAVRYAYLQTGEVIILATGSIVNWALNGLDGRGGIEGWRYMFLVQGLISIVIGALTFFWIVDFPEEAHRSFYFLTEDEQKLAIRRINADRKDVEPETFTWERVFVHAKDIKIYGFAVLFFLLNLVSTSLSYFLPIILQSGIGFDENDSILLSAPPYYYAVIPVLLSSFLGDKYNLRGPIIIFNCICLIVGFCMLGFAEQPTVRYVGTYLATGAYVSNWAALSTYQANNIAGQWKRAFTAAAVAAMNGAGGIAGSFIVRSQEAPRYITAIVSFARGTDFQTLSLLMRLDRLRASQEVQATTRSVRSLTFDSGSPSAHIF